MSDDVTLRPVTMGDADHLFVWRNDPETRAASRNIDLVSWDGHIKWLEEKISDPDCLLFMAEQAGTPVGTVRADRESDDGYELSWTLAPEARGRGFGKLIVSMLCQRLDGPFRAEIKKENAASVRIAECVGMIFQKEERGLLYYKTPSEKEQDE